MWSAIRKFGRVALSPINLSEEQMSEPPDFIQTVASMWPFYIVLLAAFIIVWGLNKITKR
jgi:hypothetical protein